MSNSNSNDDNLAVESELIRLNEKILKLEKEKARLVQVLRDNDMEEFIESDNIMLPEEAICINEILRLKQLSESGMFGTDEAKQFDTIYKNYRLCKGLVNDDRSKKKTLSKAEREKLFKLVQKDE
jgi:hypothetical protein